ncbi:T9SS type A sorting domain-containing protein [Formosa maritima]|uniref:T9SS type A sorting domain-containing protein n=1 Tax=Formosa maritima TaxID=2592046 RepID=A0A5D0GJ00_9FLAO|nr:T9SS type A sorting domain-containing protein [Formosa maritima]TYA58944.1 T9SS type A sorting domain-containing protein [Formosa maritima]
MKHLYVRKFSFFESFQNVVFFNFLFLTFILNAQNYPESIQLNSIEYDEYQLPIGDTPNYLEKNTNQFGNEVIRISDAIEFGTTDQNLRHRYSLDQPWNSDETLIKLAGYPAAILDGDTYEFLYWASIPSSASWSNLNPSIMYGVSGNSIVSYDVTTNDSETLHTFSEFSYIKYGYGKGNTSNDDKYIGLIGRNGNDQTLIVYNIQDNVVVATKFIGEVNLSWFSISPSGLYAVEYYAEDGSGDEQGIKVLDIDLTNRRHLNDYTTHSDLGLNINGEDVYVSFGDPTTRSNNYFLKSVRLSDGMVTPLYYWTESTGVWGGHISCRNINRPGWAYISEGCCDTVGQKEIFAIKLDGSDIIERYTIHHTNDDTGYGHEAHAVPNRDGNKVMFASNWGDNFTGPYPPAFIVQASSTLSIEENEEIVSNDIKVYPNPSRDGLVNIKLNGNIAVKSIQLYDMLGRTIRTEEMTSNEKTLYLSSLPAGVYLLSFLTENNGSITKRIVLN